MTALTGQTTKGSFIYYDATIVALAMAANCFVLIAVNRAQFSQPKGFYRRFLTSLATCDLYTCCVNALTLLYESYMSANKQGNGATHMAYMKCGGNIIRTLQLAGFLTNLLNLCAMSFDHLFSVLYPVRYRKVVNGTITKVAVIMIWVASFTFAFLDIPINLLLYQDANAPAGIEETEYTSSGSRFMNEPLFAADENLMTEDDDIDDELGLESSRPIEKLFGVYDDISRNLNANYSANNAPRNGRIPDPSRGPVPKMRSDDDSRRMLNSFLEMLHTADLKRNDACTFFAVKKLWFEMCVMALVIVCFFVLIICYSIIFKKVSGKFDTRGRRTRRLVSTTLIFLSAFALCWLPLMAFEFLMLLKFQKQKLSKRSEVDSMVGEVNDLIVVQSVLTSLLQTYPLLDPFIYAARVPAVKEFLIRFVEKNLPCCSCSCIANGRQSLTVNTSISIAQRSFTPGDKTLSLRNDNGEAEKMAACSDGQGDSQGDAACMQGLSMDSS